jgi:hypothetical protein
VSEQAELSAWKEHLLYWYKSTNTGLRLLSHWYKSANADEAAGGAQRVERALALLVQKYKY